MSWNEPPGDGKDPWGNRKRDQGPPDMGEVLRKMQQSLGGLFNKKPAKGGNSSGRSNSLAILVILIAILLSASYSMFYAIDEQERGVVLRLGAYVATLEPGLSVRFPYPIEQVLKVNVGQERSLTHRSTMLTQDENIIEIEVAVQWRISNPADFLFKVKDPEITLRQVTESAVREVVGQNKLDFVWTEGRSDIAQKQQELIQKIVDEYDSGINISRVKMQVAKPPDEVIAAFDDATKAREDEQRLVNEAEAYRNDVIPKARGAAARLREESAGYKARVIAKAEGESSRFEQLLAEYWQAPDVTRRRLYLDAVESVLSNTSKVLIDNDNGNSLMYLPIDQLIRKRENSSTLPQTEDFRSRVESSINDSINKQINDRKRLRGAR